MTGSNKPGRSSKLWAENYGCFFCLPIGQYFARDQELPGFAVLVGTRRKTLVVEGDVRKDGRRQSVRIKIVGALTTREARAEAKELLGKIAKGIGSTLTQFDSKCKDLYPI